MRPETVQCERRLTGRALCRGALRFTADHTGRVVASCDRCARYAARQCVDCGVPLPARAGTGAKKLRCPACATQELARIQARYDRSDKRRERRHVTERRRYQRTAEARRQYAREYRRAEKLAIIRAIPPAHPQPALAFGRRAP